MPDFGKVALSQLSDVNNHMVYNTDLTLRKWKLALANLDRSKATAVVWGDSISVGAFASDHRHNSWVGRLKKLIQDKYGDGGEGSYFLPKNSLDHKPWSSVFSYMDISDGWLFNTSSTSYSVTGIRLESTGAGKTITCTFIGDTIDIIYTKGPDAPVAGVSVAIDSIAKGTIDFNNTVITTNHKASYSGLGSGQHTLIVTSNAQFAWIDGFVAHTTQLTGSKGVEVVTLATGGMSAHDYVSICASSVALYPANLYIIALGVNDTVQGLSTFQSDLQTLITTAKNSGGDVLLLAHAMNDVAYQTKMDSNRAIMQNLARLNNCGFIDMKNVFGGNRSNFVSDGIIGQTDDGIIGWTGNEGSDGFHFSDRGHRMIGQSVFSVIG